MNLSDDEITRVLLYLWFDDLFCIARVDRRLRDLVCTNNTIARLLLVNQVRRNHWMCIETDTFCRSLSSREIFVLASRMPYWPTDIDTSNLRHELSEVEIVGQTSKCVVCSLPTSGWESSFVANNHFPVLGGETEGGLATVSDFPFTKPVYDVVFESTIPVLSGIAYFEISIHKATRPEDEIVSVVGLDGPCVAIGIANHRHRLKNMPGCDHNSYGYHFYNNSVYFYSNNTATEIKDMAFKAGDILGFGVMYARLKGHLVSEDDPPPPTVIFLTVNGHLESMYAFHNGAFDQCTWFPCVGTDCNNPVEMNFGNKGVPFAFDIVQFEKDEVRPPPPLRRSSRGKASVQKPAISVSPTAPGVARTPSLLFRAPYSTEGRFEGGLFRDRTFWQQVTAHIRGNNPWVFEDREDVDDLFGEESEVSEGSEDDSDGDSIEGESTRSLIDFSNLIG